MNQSPPQRAHSGATTLEDGRVVAWDQHGPEDGVPVIYMHGVPTGRFLGQAWIDAAADNGVRLIAPDRPGCGESTFDEHRRITDWPNDVRAIVDDLGLERYSILGVSGGGSYALACTTAADERLHRTAVVSGLGPLDTADRIKTLHDANRGFFEAAAQGLESAHGLISALTSQTMDPRELLEHLGADDARFLAAHPDVLEEISTAQTLAIANGIEGLAYDSWLATQPWDFDPARIAVPIDFYGGDHDDNVPIEHTVAQASLVPSSTLTVWPDSGHTAIYERFSEVFSRLLRQ